ncbi:MAG: DUF3192 domain-containing protein [Candidatus Omnitrophica bacterium]|nr:DUF3192 domain-containing protein [Candidatus Omnitrophota bacterium]MDD5592765.1 DUF3192 domain-containing protein [Candidatus Omnitrophota bacterium]
MRKMFFLSAMAIFLCGCATMATSQLTANNRMNLVRLSQGMSKQRVLDIMGTGISIYNCDLGSSKTRINVRLNNPHRTETIETSGKTLEILYYITDIRSNNCTIDEEELTPLVFDNSKLIGWGHNFLLEVFPEIKARQQAQQPMAEKAAPEIESKAQAVKEVVPVAAPAKIEEAAPQAAPAEVAEVAPQATDKVKEAGQLPEAK